MVTALLYYLFIKPISLLPLRAIYIITDFFYLIVFYVFPYRKKLVFTNLRNSFPQKSEQEIRQIAKKFYHHFTDLIAESIRLFSISEAEALRRFKLRDPELMQRLYAKEKSVIITGGHYNNWELLAVTINQQIPHAVAALYTHLNNPFFDKKFLQTRTKYGLQMVPKKLAKKYFEENRNSPVAIIFGADQSPSSQTKNFYRMRFLNQDTAVMFGTEKYAVEYNFSVVYMRILKVKRGFYEFESQMIEENPTTAPYGSITEKHTKLLEQDIIKAPEYWIWTHKRWKIKLPPISS